MIPRIIIRFCYLASGLFFLAGCTPSYRQPARSNFSFFTDFEYGEIVYPQREEQPRPEKNQVKVEKSSFSIRKGELHIAFPEKGGFIEFTPQAAGLPVNWKGYEKLVIRASCTGCEQGRLVLSVLDSRGVLSDTFHIKKGITTYSLSLADLPLTAGNQHPYEPELIKITPGSAPLEVVVGSLVLKGSAFPGSLAVVDRFGQRKNREWPGKTKSVNDLKQNQVIEGTILVKKLRTDWDEFGGWKNGPQLDSTGFFRVTRFHGRFWFVTPGGRLMWSFGVTGIRPNAPKVASTRITGREFLYDSLPSRTGREAICWTSPDDAGFYCWNVLRKYGSIQPWRETAFKRLDAWGYNTIGNWSEPELLKQARIPFTVSYNSNIPGGLSIKGIADVFNPRWQSGLDSIFRDASNWAANPFLLGYFVDNEAGWENLDLLASMPTDSWSRVRWLEFLQKKYPALSALNLAWGSAFKDWPDVHDLNIRLGNENFLRDYLDFEALFAEEYFRSVSTTLKKYDPNHLYLGCRFTRRIKPEHICRMAGKYCDVITVNVYARTPADEVMGEWYRRTGKPILIGEHHINLASPRQVPARWGASTPVERREYYSNYVETWAKLPYSLGCHWYQFSDQEITGRSSNGENQPVGLVDITDQPHLELVETAKLLSRKIYEWHLKGLP